MARDLSSNSAYPSGSDSVSIDIHFENLLLGHSGSVVFLKEGEICKLTMRNSLERLQSDYKRLLTRMKGFEEYFPKTRIVSSTYQDTKHACVVQPFIEGVHVADLSEAEYKRVIDANRPFLLALLEFFFESLEKRELYPDMTGWSEDQSFRNCVNMKLMPEGKLMMVDIGLSPHEDTLIEHGQSFYDSENVAHYREKMCGLLKELSRERHQHWCA